MGIVEDTFAEAFYGLYVRVLVTAERGVSPEDLHSCDLWKDELRFAAYRSTSTPATVVGRTEAGIEGFIPKEKTPDGREGVILQFWSMFNAKKPLEEQVERFYREVSIPVRQDILSCYTTNLFNWLEQREGIDIVGSMDTQRYVGDCGGGYERHLIRHNREVIEIPLMGGHDFIIERKLNVGKGISGANFWIFCESLDSARKAGRKAVESIDEVEGAITSFYVCPSGSMVGNYREIGPPTNYNYCPTLRGKIKKSQVPRGVKAIPEIVVDGISLEAVKQAMKAGISAAADVDGVCRISAGNYEGKLGQVKLQLREIVPRLFE